MKNIKGRHPGCKMESSVIDELEKGSKDDNIGILVQYIRWLEWEITSLNKDIDRLNTWGRGSDGYESKR